VSALKAFLVALNRRILPCKAIGLSIFDGSESILADDGQEPVGALHIRGLSLLRRKNNTIEFDNTTSQREGGEVEGHHQ
jgi:hypothetical protein